MEKSAILTISSHNISFSKMHPYLRDALSDYCRYLMSYEKKPMGRGKPPKLVKKDVYAASPINRSEIRFHINHKDDVLNHLKNYGFKDENFEIIIKDPFPGKDCDFPIKDTREPYDYQVGIIDYLVNEGKTKVITLGTGSGKTLCALSAVAKIGKRLMIVILGRYVDKWITDVEEAFHLKKDDLVVIRGGKNLISLMNHAIAETLNAKIIICTSTTIQKYLKDHELGGITGYPIKPDELYERLDVGVTLHDECHMFFHLNFKMDLYSHINRSIFLSATLEPSDGFLNNMYRVIYPLDVRLQGKSHDKYIDVSAISYKIKGAKKVRVKRNGSYSHTLFESEVMKSKSTLLPYLEMIWKISEDSYMDIKKEGQKLLIFAATVDMCTHIKDYFVERVNDDLSVAKYTAEDNWDNLHNNDIVVSTMGSAGTAVDIINLRTTIMTVSIASIQQNVQALGRLRKLVNYPGDHPEFLYLYCQDIDKQRAYHIAKYDLFKDYCRSHKHYDTNYKLNFSYSR